MHNRAHTIIETLRSVVAQDYREFEVLVVDDGSTDDGPERVQQLNDPRVRLIRQQHLGVSAARNRGVAEAHHELLAFLDSDDIWLPAYLSRMKHAAEAHPDAGMYCCAGYVLHPDGSGGVRYSPRYGGRSFEVDFFSNPPFFGNSSCTVVRRNVFSAAGGFPVGVKHYEDWTFFRSAALPVKVVYCSAPLVVVHKGFVGQVSNDAAAAHLDYVDMTNHVFRLWTELGRPRDYLVFTLYEMRSLLWRHFKVGDYQKVRLILDRLDPKLTARMSRLEWWGYRIEWLRPIGIAWGYTNKIVWRARRRPRVVARKALIDSLPPESTVRLREK